MNYCALCKSNKWCGRPCAKAPTVGQRLIEAAKEAAEMAKRGGKPVPAKRKGKK